MSKDYYKVLGIEKNASVEQIKAAFRKLAHQYHPDKAGGDEAKFKEINEAYQVLGNADKRGKYDQYGSTFDQMGGFGGGMNWEDFMQKARGGGGGFGNVNFDFGGLDLGDIFGDFMGFGGGRSSRGRTSYGEDIQIDLPLDFKEAVFGVKKEVTLYKAVKCPRCHGNMAEPGTKISTCQACGGRGKVTQVRQTFLGSFQSTTTCSACNGEGKKAEKPCTECRGQGVIKQKENIEIDVPAGVENGTTLKMEGRGNAGAFGGGNGDLFAQIRVKEDKRFERDGNDVYVNKKISFVEAALGAKIEVETLDGVIELTVPEGTQPGTKFRLRGKGVPYLRSSGRGDMYVVLEVEVPKRLSRRQRKLLEEFNE